MLTFEAKLQAAIDRYGDRHPKISLSPEAARLIERYSGKDILVKCAAGHSDRTSVPGNCVLADDFIVHQLYMNEDGLVINHYGPTIYRIDHDFDLSELVDLRPLGLGEAVMGNSHDVGHVPPEAVEKWLKTGANSGYHKSAIARNIKPGVIGVGLVDPEILINVPCRMVVIGELVIGDDGRIPEVGEEFKYKVW